MKLPKTPSYFPFAPYSERLKGLEFVAKHLTMNQFERACNVLVRNGTMHKSKQHNLLRRLRKIKGISYEE